MEKYSSSSSTSSSYSSFLSSSSSLSVLSSAPSLLSLTTMSSSCSDFEGNYGHFNEDYKQNGFLGLRSDLDRGGLLAPASNVNDQSVALKRVSGSTDQSKEVNKKGENNNKKAKKPRYAFQTRSQVDILDDGYRWRKYGQKAVKNNKFPRSYYRCTYQGCNVKKQVQRLTRDEGMVVTTYEGMHSHPIEKSTDNFEHILSQLQIYSNNSF